MIAIVQHVLPTLLRLYPGTDAVQFSCSFAFINGKKLTMPFPPRAAHISTRNAIPFRSTDSCYYYMDARGCQGRLLTGTEPQPASQPANLFTERLCMGLGNIEGCGKFCVSFRM